LERYRKSESATCTAGTPNPATRSTLLAESDGCTRSGSSRTAVQSRKSRSRRKGTFTPSGCWIRPRLYVATADVEGYQRAREVISWVHGRRGTLGSLPHIFVWAKLWILESDQVTRHARRSVCIRRQIACPVESCAVY